MESSGYDFGKKLYTVTINFLNNETNQPLPNIQPSILIKRAGEKFELQKIAFPLSLLFNSRAGFTP